MSRTRELLRSVRNLSILRDLTRNQGALETMGDPGDNFIDSEVMNVCLQRFKALSGGEEIVEQRLPIFFGDPCSGDTAGGNPGSCRYRNQPPPE